MQFLPNYRRALVRKPGNRFAEGQTSAKGGKPFLPAAIMQHEHYCEILEAIGLELTVLEADERFPDGCFVEDTAVITEEVAIITRPGVSSRLGEEEAIAAVLAEERPLAYIRAPGTLDGGDVMRIGSHFYIGLSGRTNEEGARQLADILDQYGYSSSIVPVTSVLHLKTGITPLAPGLFVAIEEFAKRPEFQNSLLVKGGDAYSANCLRINDILLIPISSSARFKKQLADHGLSFVEAHMSEFRKMDGGLTCLSLLWK